MLDPDYHEVFDTGSESAATTRMNAQGWREISAPDLIHDSLPARSAASIFMARPYGGDVSWLSAAASPRSWCWHR